MVYFELIAVAVICILSVIVFRNKRDPRWPPGPMSLPFIGNLIEFGNPAGPHITLQKWAKKYGPVISFKIGTEMAIVVSDPKLLKELFSKYSSSGRPRNVFFDKYTDGGYGVLNSDGHNWVSQRRFLIRKLKEFGLGKSSMLEGLISDEAKVVVKRLVKTKGVPLPMNGFFTASVVGTLWGLVTSERDLSKETDNPPEILETAATFMRAGNAAVAKGLPFLPALRFIAPGFFGWTNFIKATINFKESIMQTINKHITKLDVANPVDIIDHYLVEIQKTQDNKSTFFQDLGRKNLFGVISDIFIAGSDTTSKTLEWAILYLSQHQRVQKCMQKELDTVIGNSRLPTLSDKPMLTYTEAVILEILRLSSLVSISIPHKMLEDDEFHGYFLPKGALVLGSFYTIHHDSKIWGDDVNEFRPERFLTEDGTKVVYNSALMPFGTGKRQCIGESMGMDTLFLFITCIFQKFNVDPDPDCKVADLNAIPGIIVTPKPFRIVVSDRHVQ